MAFIELAEALLMDDAQGALEPFVLALHNNDEMFRSLLFEILLRLDKIKLGAAVKNSANGDEFIRILRELENAQDPETRLESGYASLVLNKLPPGVRFPF